VFGPELMAEGGFSLEINNVEKNGLNENTYRILGVPLALKYSTVVGGVQPRKGVKVVGKIYPYMTVFGRTQRYLKTELNPEIYCPVTAEENVVIAAQGTFGFMPGAGKRIVPSHKLYYPGGVETLRGYKFQMAGPLDTSNNPVGGRSMMLMSLGVNNYVTDTVTLSGYMDWGTAYNRQYTDFSSRMMWGIGAGIRYHSSYGDFRFDVASPVARRSTDSAVEFYVSYNVKPYEVYKGLYRTLTPPEIQNTDV
jgi:translocation and assembly module TamA